MTPTNRAEWVKRRENDAERTRVRATWRWLRNTLDEERVKSLRQIKRLREVDVAGSSPASGS